jgi:hypothetical protein
VHQSFGSVWDSQLGSGQAAASSAGPVVETFLPDEDEEDLEEPEIPEYLLAERRRPQTGGGQRGRMGRGRGAYQAALDRERFVAAHRRPAALERIAGRLVPNESAPRARASRGDGRGRCSASQDRARFRIRRASSSPRPMVDRPAGGMASGDQPVVGGSGRISRRDDARELAARLASGPVSRQDTARTAPACPADRRSRERQVCRCLRWGAGGGREARTAGGARQLPTETAAGPPVADARRRAGFVLPWLSGQGRKRADANARYDQGCTAATSRGGAGRSE